MANIYFNHGMDCEQRRLSIFEGNLLQYSVIPATQNLVNHALLMMEKAFSPYQPERAQYDLPVELFIQRVGALKTLFTNDLRTKELVREVLIAFGCNLEETFFDVPRLRVVPHGAYLTSGVSYAYKAHRDTWYASPSAQLNWWMPVCSVTAERAMSFFPEYWDKYLKNSSAEFDYAEWCKVGRNMAMSQGKEDTRQHPVPLEAVNHTSELRLAATPGDLTLFSAAHLHATADNTSGLTRFSIDFRTLNLLDINNNKGAPLVDSSARGTTKRDFLRASNFKPLEV